MSINRSKLYWQIEHYGHNSLNREIVPWVSTEVKQMIKQKYGRIISLSGGGADRPMEHMTIYSASKGGVAAFSQCLAKELEATENDIKINIFQPGMIFTNLYNVTLLEAWKDKDTYDAEMEILKKYLCTLLI